MYFCCITFILGMQLCRPSVCPTPAPPSPLSWTCLHCTVLPRLLSQRSPEWRKLQGTWNVPRTLCVIVGFPGHSVSPCILKERADFQQSLVESSLPKSHSHIPAVSSYGHVHSRGLRTLLFPHLSHPRERPSFHSCPTLALLETTPKSSVFSDPMVLALFADSALLFIAA